MEHFAATELEAGVDHIRRSPVDAGRLEMIVRRPAVDAREVLAEGELSCDEGLVGDSWRARGSTRTADGAAQTDKQLTVMNARSIALLASDQDRWPLAGDQLYVDFDLSVQNLPTGTRLSLGSAVIEVTEAAHTGCGQFSDRFGREAVRFVNSEVGRELRLRGLNAKVVQSGTVRQGDTVTKI